MWTWPVVIMVSTATRLFGSSESIASRMESLIWSAILSGWPSVTDSEVKRRRDTRHSLTWWTSRRTVRSTAAGRNATGWGGHRCAHPSRSVLRGAREAGADGRPDPRGHGVLRAARHLDGRAVGGEDDDAVLRPAEDLPGRDVVDHEQVAALPRELHAGVGEH